MQEELYRRAFLINGVSKNIGVTPVYSYDILHKKTIYLPLHLFPTAVVGGRIDRVRYIDEYGNERSKWEPVG